jgi:transposase
MSSHQPQRIELEPDRLSAIVEAARACGMPDDMVSDIEAVFTSLAFVHAQVEQKGTTIHRLRRMLFGARTEKTRNVCGPAGNDGQASGSSASNSNDSSDQATSNESKPGAGEGSSSDAGPKQKPKRKGHGRNGAASYRGAEHVAVAHPSLRPGDDCPSCEQGRLYLLPPAVLVRIRAQAPITGHVYELGRLRCSSCGQVFKAPAPASVGEEKYDVTTAVLIAVLKYGFGLPFYRMARLQEAAAVPVPAATQWDLLLRTIAGPEAIHRELIRQAAQATLLHNDDTYATLLGPVRRPGVGPDLEDEPDSESESERTGTFTSGIVAIKDGVRIALFFTGHQHAGENLADVLRQRAGGLDPPLQMCDALSRNLPKEFETILCNCMSHARRSFVDVEPRFPDECRHVLETLRDVYRNDELARQQGLSPPDRLAWHQEHSAPLMNDLKKWFKAQFKEKKVEPNSTLGEAIQYMQKHWHELTQFLRVVGAPLDNNVVERALKRAILHRKNSLFFRTERGAHFADVYMSLI